MATTMTVYIVIFACLIVTVFGRVTNDDKLPQCLYGTAGTCCRVVGVKCPSGSHCLYIPSKLLGICCKNKPDRCPPSPPGIITICALGCHSDAECKNGQICCPYGCTSGCTTPVY